SKIDLPLKAYFSSLSADGKKITYQLNSDSSKKLCPGNGTLDGEYEITSDFFPNSLRTQYHERIHKNSICGFILNTSQTSLANVSVKLYIDSQNTAIASTTTDSNGYYEFQNITDKNITLQAELENYDTYSLSPLNPSGQNICQNIIMHPNSIKNLAVTCQILNKQNQAVKNTAVILTTKNADFTANTSSIHSSDQVPPTDGKTENFFLQGIVDSNGFISFANQETINSDNYTQISYHSNQSIPEYLHAKMPVSDSIVHNPLHVMTRNQDYILYVFPATDGSTIPRDYQMESFSFSFDSLLSDSLFLQIQLQDLPLLKAGKVSIQPDTLSNSVSSYHYSLYDKKGNELFQTSLSPLSKDIQNDYSKQLTAALQYDKVRLVDGDYYAAVTAFSSISSTKADSSDIVESAISGTTILPIKIQNNTSSPASFILSPCQIFHSLTFINNYDENLENLSFILYQKQDTSWFPVGTYTTNSFTSIHSGQKAYLNIPVSSGTDYYLKPLSTEYQITSGNYFAISRELENMIDIRTSKQENMIRSNTSGQGNMILSNTSEQGNMISAHT
ncbi:MAG: carboxypeptidase-like regulatory domain-containing protein, partial [Lachnospiraceae bacterium]|nr:carboxypeptidase-like regulatory domain-containing protein [Lachnospiraceae bacterium]